MLVQLIADKQQERMNETALQQTDIHSLQITFPATMPFLRTTKINKPV